MWAAAQSQAAVRDVALEKVFMQKAECLFAGSKSAEMTELYVVIGNTLLFSVLSVPCPSQSRDSRISLSHWETRSQIPLFLVSR